MSTPRFWVVPHTHWDREWYQPFEYFRLALGRVVDEVLDVLETDPSFTSFTLDGQAIVLEDYVEARPGNEGRLRALLAAGRIEVGPSYILPDEFLVGAEPLVRNLLIGRAVCERFGARPSPVGYMPDSFGHPLQFPQLLNGFGIESFIFSRGMGDELDETGVVFRWRSPDGSEVTAFQQLADYSNFADVATADDGERRARELIDAFGAQLARVGIDDILLCNGSDHLPITAQLPALCGELEQRFPGSSFAISSFDAYVRAVGNVDVPARSGELLGSRIQNVLRGVNSARLYVKQANERAERHLLRVETLVALRSLHDDATFPTADVTLAWRELLKCHPHDTICGCSCDEVHRDAMYRYASLHRTLSVMEWDVLRRWAVDHESSSAVGVVNALPYRCRELVEVPGAEPMLVELDGFSARTVELAAAQPSRPSEGSAIETAQFRIEAGSDGALTLIDKDRGNRYERLHVLEDEPDMGDLYNFCPVEGEPVWRPRAADIRVLRAGPLVHELEIRWAADRPAGLDSELRPTGETVPMQVTTIVRLVEGSRRIAFRTTIANAAENHRLRVAFPAGAGVDVVRAEGHFAVLRRPVPRPAPRAEWAEPPDATDHTLGAVALGTLGLITRGLPEYEAGNDRAGGAELRLTLLRCVGVIAQPGGVLATRPRHAGPATPTPEGQCLGRHELEYALVPGADELDDAALVRASQQYRYGVITTSMPVRFDAPIRLQGDAVFSCLKGAEDGDGVILRCFNPSDQPVDVRVDGDVSIERARLDETADAHSPDRALTIRPGEIVSLRARRGSRSSAATMPRAAP